MQHDNGEEGAATRWAARGCAEGGIRQHDNGEEGAAMRMGSARSVCCYLRGQRGRTGHLPALDRAVVFCRICQRASNASWQLSKITASQHLGEHARTG